MQEVEIRKLGPIFFPVYSVSQRKILSKLTKLRNEDSEGILRGHGNSQGGKTALYLPISPPPPPLLSALLLQAAGRRPSLPPSLLTCIGAPRLLDSSPPVRAFNVSPWAAFAPPWGMAAAAAEAEKGEVGGGGGGGC